VSGVPQEVPPSKEMIQHYRAETDDDDQKQAHIQVKYFLSCYFSQGYFCTPLFPEIVKVLFMHSLSSPRTPEKDRLTAIRRKF
jgi:hypothetical protein